MLPIETESYDSLRARFQVALGTEWPQVESVQLDRAGMHREHVFDCDDGIRLIISKETTDHDDTKILHISASLFQEKREWARIRPFAKEPSSRYTHWKQAQDHCLMAIYSVAGFDATKTAKPKMAVTEAGVMWLLQHVGDDRWLLTGEDDEQQERSTTIAAQGQKDEAGNISVPA
jgi:hypothetical protein